MAIWLCNNKGMYDRDVKDEELLCSNLFLLLVTLLSEVILSYLGTKPNAASTVSVDDHAGDKINEMVLCHVRLLSQSKLRITL